MAEAKKQPTSNSPKMQLKAGTQITIGGSVYSLTREPAEEDLTEKGGIYHLELPVKRM